MRDQRGWPDTVDLDQFAADGSVRLLCVPPRIEKRIRVVLAWTIKVNSPQRCEAHVRVGPNARFSFGAPCAMLETKGEERFKHRVFLFLNLQASQSRTFVMWHSISFLPWCRLNHVCCLLDQGCLLSFVYYLPCLLSSVLIVFVSVGTFSLSPGDHVPRGVA